MKYLKPTDLNFKAFHLCVFCKAGKKNLLLLNETSGLCVDNAKVVVLEGKQNKTDLFGYLRLDFTSKELC